MTDQSNDDAPQDSGAPAVLPVDLSPEEIAAIWARLEGEAAKIADAETREQYLAKWRAAYDERFPRWLSHASIVSLPDWKHLGEISPQERRRAELVNQAWIDAATVDPDDGEAVKRFSWEMGRRVAAGLIDEERGGRVLARVLGSSVSTKGSISAWQRGLASAAAGEALIAAMVCDQRCALIERNEDGLAQRFVLRHGHDFRHTVAKGWMRWDGKRWKVLDEERGEMPAELLNAARDTVSAIGREAFVVAATGIDEASIPEWMADLAVDPEERAKIKVETDEGKLPLFDLPKSMDGMDRPVITASTCRLLSVVLRRWGASVAELKRYKAMTSIARGSMTVRYQDFDTDPLTINCQNGTLRLLRHVERDDSGDRQVRVEARLDPHDRGDLLTKIAAVAYDPDALCPNYDGTIEWAQPDADMRRYIHQWGGYNVTGDMGAQIFHMWWGPLAQNGKSTLLDAWADAAGDYAEAGKIETFMEAAQARGGDAATPALAQLPGVRMLRTGEPPNNAKFDESLINTITGQDTLQVRDNFRSFYPVKMQFKLTVACNAQPTIPNATEGIKRRIKVVPFEKTMNGALKPDGTPLRDDKFKEKLVPELPGIFVRLIDGALDWLRHGFIEPGKVTQWTDEYKDENDPLGRFLSFCTAIDPDSRIQASRFHELFQAWSKATGGPDWSMPHLKKKMGGKGYSSKQSNGMQWLGLRAVKDVQDFIDEHGNVIDLSDQPDSPAHAGGAVSARENAAGQGAGGGEPDPWGADLPDL